MRIKNISILKDIIQQSREDFHANAKFLLSFFLYYFTKILGEPICIFPQMKLMVGDSLFISRRKTIDFWMLWKNHEKENFSKMSKMDKKGIFIDVGANIGKYSVIMAKEGWFVYAFEPVKSNFDSLEDNIRLNDVSKKIKRYNIGMGNKIEKRYISFQNGKHAEASVVIKMKNSRKEKVEINKIDSFFKGKKIKRPVVLKIDVEGFEYSVLEGAKKFIEKEHPVIILEMWENKKDSEFLGNLGYKREGDFWFYKK